jgi:hypothetical protein
MDIISRFIANRIAPEAVKSFWSEVVVYVGVFLIGLALAIGLKSAANAPDSRMHEQAWLYALFLAACPVSPLIRAFARKALGLHYDPNFWTLPPGGRTFGGPGLVFPGPRPAEEVPAWQRENGLYARISITNVQALTGTLALIAAAAVLSDPANFPDPGNLAASLVIAAILAVVLISQVTHKAHHPDAFLPPRKLDELGASTLAQLAAQNHAAEQARARYGQERN